MKPTACVVTAISFGLTASITNNNNVAESQTSVTGCRTMMRTLVVLAVWVATAAAQPIPGDTPRGSAPRPVDLVVQSGHTAEIRAVEYTRDGRFFATAGKDSTIRIWSPGGALIRTIVTSFWVNALALSRDGTTLLVAQQTGAI